MTPAPYDIVVIQDQTFAETFRWAYLPNGGVKTYYDLTANGCRARAQFRVNGVVVLTLDSSNAGNPDAPIVLDNVGTISWSVAESVIDAITRLGTGKWSLKGWRADGSTMILVAGKFRIQASTTV